MLFIVDCISTCMYICFEGHGLTVVKLFLSLKRDKRMSPVLQSNHIVPHYKCILIRKYIKFQNTYKVPFFEMMKIFTKFVVVVIVRVGVTTGQDFFHYRT